MVAGIGIVMELQHWLTLLGIVSGLVIQAVVGAVFLTQKLAGMKEALTREIIEQRDELKAELAMDRRVVGESMAALREKINLVELEGAKHYVRRESWHQAMNQLQDSIGKGEQADQQWKLRIEEKIDRMNDKIAVRA